MMSLSHSDAVWCHARKRLWERYGLGITKVQYLELCLAVRDRLHRPDGWLMSRSPVWRVTHCGRPVWACWHNGVEAIGTFVHYHRSPLSAGRHLNLSRPGELRDEVL